MPKPHLCLWLSRCMWSSLNFYQEFHLNHLSIGQSDQEGHSFHMGGSPTNWNTAFEGHNLSFPALCHLNYKSGWEVVLAVHTSMIVVRYILSQKGNDGKQYLNCFSSVSLTEVKSWYSQAKLELYRLFHVLWAVWFSSLELLTSQLKWMSNMSKVW